MKRITASVIVTGKYMRLRIKRKVKIFGMEFMYKWRYTTVMPKGLFCMGYLFPVFDKSDGHKDICHNQTEKECRAKQTGRIENHFYR